MDLPEVIRKIEQNLEKIGGLRNIKVHFSETDTYIRYRLASENYQDKYKTMCCWLKNIISVNNPYMIIECYPPENCKTKDNNLERKIVIKVSDLIVNDNERQQILEKAALEFNSVLKRLVKYGTKK